MKSQGSVYVIMEEHTERQAAGYGRDKWVTTITALAGYSSYAEANMAALKLEHACVPDGHKYYYISEVEIIK